MGFTIFTSSGTFNPATYGLNPGDMIHIKCVGGGGGGGSKYGPGSNGGASSFGSILSAAGGNGGTKTNSPPSSQTGSCLGGVSISGMRLPDGTNDYGFYAGGAGGHGWVPGKSTPMVAGNVSALIGSRIVRMSSSGMTAYPDIGKGNCIEICGMMAPFILGGTVDGIYTESASPYGNYGGVNSNGATYMLGGTGGLGYGAGGGSSQAGDNIGSGGNGGVIADNDYVLTSTDSISVTVGSGGKGYKRNGGAFYNGGGGARGCVAIWW